MDIALGDLRLGMPGLHLHVDERVPRGRFMCQRGMPQVVEGSKGIGDPGTLKSGLQIRARQLAGIRRAPEFVMAEDSLVFAGKRGASVAVDQRRPSNSPRQIAT